MPDCLQFSRDFLMKATKAGALALMIVFAAAFVAHTSVAGEESSAPQKTQQNNEQTSARAACQSYCDSAETKCSSEVRRARQQCSKRAATAGRDPFTGRNNDYTYFCGYFNNAGACGAGNYSGACRTRFARTYGLCIDAIQENIASMRYDCYQTETTAQRYCRDELRECKAACE